MRADHGRLYATEDEVEAIGADLAPAEFVRAAPPQIADQLGQDVEVVIIGGEDVRERLHPTGWGECPACGKAAVLASVSVWRGRRDDPAFRRGSTGAAFTHAHGEPAFAILRRGRWVHVDADQAATWHPVGDGRWSRPLRVTNAGWWRSRLRLFAMAAWVLRHPLRALAVFRRPL